MRVNNRLVCVLTLAACSALSAACNRSGSERTGATASGSVTDTAQAQGAPAPVALRHFTGDVHQADVGRALFVSLNCYTCHGGSGGGGYGPNLRDTTFKYGYSDSLIFSTIKNGRPLGMPHWGSVLPDSEIRLLVTYIHSMRTDAEPKFVFQWPDTLRAAKIMPTAVSTVLVAR